MTSESTRSEIERRAAGIRAALNAQAGALSAQTATAAAELLGRAEQRQGLGDDFTVVAFAGSTGSGKSSLFNAVSGLEIAQVGVRRPTTSKPTACVWGSGGEDLLDWLEVPAENRTWRESALDGHDEEALHGLVLLDLPDHDSTAQAHRVESDRLVGMVDVVLWIVDPQKYADYALHSRYLTRLAEYSDSVVVVLNQVDRLAFDERRATADHLRKLLEHDGLADAEVRLASAATREGVPELRTLLQETVSAHDAAGERLVADLQAMGQRIRGELGEPVADPEQLAGADRLVAAMEEAAGVEALAQTVHDDYLRRAYRVSAYPVLARLQRGKPDPLGARHGGDRDDLLRAGVPETSPAQSARVNLAAHEFVAEATAGLPLSWRDSVSSAEKRGTAQLTETLDEAVTGVHLERPTPGWWGAARFFQVLFFVLTIIGALALVAGIIAAVLGLLDGSPLLWIVPAGVLVLGAVGSLITSVLAAGARLRGADRAAAQVRERMADAIGRAAAGSYFAPIAQVLAEHRAIYDALR